MAYALAADKTDATLSASDHPNHHNDLADAVNDLDVNRVATLEAPTIGTHAARLAAAHHAGRQWKETDTGLIYLDNGATWDIWKGDGLVRKSSDQTMADAAIANDAHLAWPVEANEEWFFELFARVSGTGTAADFQWGWSFPAAATASWALGAAQGGWSQQPVGSSPSSEKVEGSTVATGSAAAISHVYFAGWWYIGANAGAVTLKRGPNTTGTGETCKILKGSFLRLRRHV